MLSDHDMVVAGACENSMPHLLGEGWSILPSPSEAMSPIMARSGDGGPPRAKPLMMVSEMSPMGGEAQTAKAVDDELKTPKENGFAEGEATA
jgi:hypothetical protein